MAYQRFQEVFGGGALRAAPERAGARVQRPLWASTSTKNPEYRDVDLRGGADRAGHGEHHAAGDARGVRRPRRGGAAPWTRTWTPRARELARPRGASGIDLDRVTRDLQVEGVEKFVVPFRDLLRRIEEKLEKVGGRA